MTGMAESSYETFSFYIDGALTVRVQASDDDDRPGPPVHTIAGSKDVCFANYNHLEAFTLGFVKNASWE